MKKAFFSGLVFTAAIALASIVPAQAAAITYKLDNVTFDDGGSATGSFVYESADHLISWFNFSTAGGLLNSFTYDAISSVLLSSSGASDYFVFIENAGNRYLVLGFADKTLDQGGTHALVSITSLEASATGERFVTSGNAIGTFADAPTTGDVPEPSTPMLAMAAIGALALIRRKTTGNAG